MQRLGRFQIAIAGFPCNRVVTSVLHALLIILDEIQAFDYGKFAHIVDPEGNRVELWEPNDENYGSMVDGKTTS